MMRTAPILWVLIAGAALGQPSPAPAPSLEDLAAIERSFAAVCAKARACTVSLRIRSEEGGSASGVIVSDDGLVLTAAHCVPSRGEPVEVVLDDGRRLRGVALGKNGLADAGMVRITTKGTWPAAPLGDPSALRRNQICLGFGHPGGREEGRAAPVRFGVIRDVPSGRRRFLRTTCLIAPGDSGGPLFDLHGRVIGIHSYITSSLRANFQVPVETFRRDWDRLLAGEQWNLERDGPEFNGPPARGVIGVTLDEDADECLVEAVREGLPAAKAGIRAGDVILEIDEEPIANRRVLGRVMRSKEPGDRIGILLRRGEEELDVTLVLGSQERRRR